MKTKTKRLSALFLALAMSLGVLQASAFAAKVVVDPSDVAVVHMDTNWNTMNPRSTKMVLTQSMFIVWNVKIPSL